MSSFDATDYVDVSGDGGLFKKILAEGSGEYPNVGDEVEAHYTGTLDDGSVFDSSRTRGKIFKFVIGKGQVIKGWDQGFISMKKGEKALLRCRSDYAYGPSGQGSIPANATLTFDVELLGFGPKKKEIWELSNDERISEANKLKTHGTELFNQKSYNEAITSYEEALTYIDDTIDLTLWISLKLNLSQTFININNYIDAIKVSTDVIGKDNNNIKALYRRGISRSFMGFSEEAINDLTQVIQLDPTNVSAKNEIIKIKKLIKENTKKEKALYSNMFSKVSVYDDKPIPVVPG